MARNPRSAPLSAAASLGASSAAIATDTGEASRPADATTAAGLPPVDEQAAAVARADEIVGQSVASGAAAEDVKGSAREAPGIGSGTVGATVPGDIIRDRGAAGPLAPGLAPAELRETVREIVREELAVRDRSVFGGGFVHPSPALDVDTYDLEITSRVDGFRRGGIAHPGVPTKRRSGDFTAEQLRQIRREPNLIVRFLD